VAKLLTDRAGSSRYFVEGFVVYSNRAKMRRLGVPAGLLRRQGAVSGPVAGAMAESALVRADVDLGVALTGIAGPGGAVPGKPVGTVWIAWARRRRGKVVIVKRRYVFSGSRDAVRRQSAAEALIGLQSII
jgi:nicotinamide-nucleotide amidase